MTDHDYIIGSGDITTSKVIRANNAWEVETVCKILDALLKIMEDENVSK